METAIEFNLNAAIRAWRENLSHSPQFRAENLNELEAHLRDAIATMQGQQLTDEEVFLVASRRLGGVRALEPEFAKINAREVWLNRALWMLLGIQLMSVVYSVSGAVSRMLVMAGLSGLDYRFHHEIGPSWRASAGPAALFAVGQIICLILILAMVWRWATRGGKSVSSVVANVLQRPLLLALAVFVVSLLLFALRAEGYAESVFYARVLGIQQTGGLIFSRSLASALLSAAQIIALATFTALLARRLFLRRARAA